MSLITLYPKIKNWPKSAGAKPNNTQLKLVHDKNLARPGSKDALAVAMALRPQGTTQNQIKAVLGNPHRNKLARLVERGDVKRVAMPMQDNCTVYKIELRSRIKSGSKKRKSEAEAQLTA